MKSKKRSIDEIGLEELKEWKEVLSFFNCYDFIFFEAKIAIATIGISITSLSTFTYFLAHFPLAFLGIPLVELLFFFQIINRFDKLYIIYRQNHFVGQSIGFLYDQLIEDLLQLINSSTLDSDPVSISILVSNYLIPQGILSVTDSFKYVDFSNNEIPREYDCGVLIVFGNGVCRHVNSFLVDLLRKKGIKADKMDCYSKWEKELGADNEIDHTIIGYFDEEYYKFIDGVNHLFHIREEENYYQTSMGNYYVLAYQQTNDQNDFTWYPGIPYQAIPSEEINEKNERIFTKWKQGEFQRFMNFKEEHFEQYQKLVYLCHQEFNKKVEYQKVKADYMNKKLKF